MKTNFLCKRPRSKEVVQNKIDYYTKIVVDIIRFIVACIFAIITLLFFHLFSSGIFIDIIFIVLLSILIFISSLLINIIIEIKRKKLYYELYGRFNDSFERISLTEIEDLIEVDGDIVKIQPLINKNKLFDYVDIYLRQEDMVIVKLVESEDCNYLQTNKNKQYKLTDEEFKILKNLEVC
jgi:hypothetical protein